MPRALRACGRLLAALLLGVPVGCLGYVIQLAVLHPSIGALLVHHPLLVLPAVLGGAGWAAVVLGGIDPGATAQLYVWIVAAACAIHLRSERIDPEFGR